MKNYGYWYVLNHIACAVDAASKEAGFKDLVELDMFNRASILVLPHAEPRALQLIRDLSESLYPNSDINPSVEQRMMLVQALHDAELKKILGDTKIFVPHVYTDQQLMIDYGFFRKDDKSPMFMPYYLRRHIMASQAVFCEDRLVSFESACSTGEITSDVRRYCLLPAQAYGSDSMPEKYRETFYMF